MKNKDIGIDINNFSIEEEIAKFATVKVPGWQVLVRLYMEPEITAGGIILTAKSQEEGEYRNCVGLVVKMGPACYKGARFEGCEPWCKVGEWRVFPRNAGLKKKYKGLPVWTINDDAVGIGVDDPRDIDR